MSPVQLIQVQKKLELCRSRDCSPPVYLYAVGRTRRRHANTAWTRSHVHIHKLNMCTHSKVHVFLVSCLSSEQPAHVGCYFKSLPGFELQTLVGLMCRVSFDF